MLEVIEVDLRWWREDDDKIGDLLLDVLLILRFLQL